MTPPAKLPPVSTTPAAILPPVSTTPAVNFSTIFASIVDTGGKPVSTTPVANCHRYQRHRRQICHRCKRHGWQTIGTIIKLLPTKNEIEKKTYLYANSITQMCPKEIIQIFQIEDFFHLPPVWLTPVANLELRISPRVFEKI
jgi:hypothetical protein